MNCDFPHLNIPRNAFKLSKWSSQAHGLFDATWSAQGLEEGGCPSPATPRLELPGLGPTPTALCMPSTESSLGLPHLRVGSWIFVCGFKLLLSGVFQSWVSTPAESAL